MGTPTVAEALVARRVEIGEKEELGRPLTQEAAADLMGVKSNQVNRWEKGQIPEDLTSFAALQRFLGISQDELGALIIESRVRKWREALAQ